MGVVEDANGFVGGGGWPMHGYALHTMCLPYSTWQHPIALF